VKSIPTFDTTQQSSFHAYFNYVD